LKNSLTITSGVRNDEVRCGDGQTEKNSQNKCEEFFFHSFSIFGFIIFVDTISIKNKSAKYEGLLY